MRRRRRGQLEGLGVGHEEPAAVDGRTEGMDPGSGIAPQGEGARSAPKKKSARINGK